MPLDPPRLLGARIGGNLERLPAFAALLGLLGQQREQEVAVPGEPQRLGCRDGPDQPASVVAFVLGDDAGLPAKES